MVMSPTLEIVVVPAVVGVTVTVVEPTTNFVTVNTSPVSTSVSLLSINPLALLTVNVVSSSVLPVSGFATGASFTASICII